MYSFAHMRDKIGASRGVGFVLLHCRENCCKMMHVQPPNGTILGSKPLNLPFCGDSPLDSYRCKVGDVITTSIPTCFMQPTNH